MNLKINFNNPLALQYEKLISDTIEHIEERVVFPEGELSISFIDTNESKKLNEQYRSKKSATDVLTFPIFDEDIIGDVYICIEEVHKKADEYGINKEEQLVMTIAHAFAHLEGYDHNTDKEKEVMEDYEDFLLKNFN